MCGSVVCQRLGRAEKMIAQKKERRERFRQIRISSVLTQLVTDALSHLKCTARSILRRRGKANAYLHGSQTKTTACDLRHIYRSHALVIMPRKNQGLQNRNDQEGTVLARGENYDRRGKADTREASMEPRKRARAGAIPQTAGRPDAASRSCEPRRGTWGRKPARPRSRARPR